MNEHIAKSYVKVKFKGEGYVHPDELEHGEGQTIFDEDGNYFAYVRRAILTEIPPALPTTPGSVIRLTDGRFALFAGKWWETHDQYLEPDELGPNWELIHDAGEGA